MEKIRDVFGGGLRDEEETVVEGPPHFTFHEPFIQKTMKIFEYHGYAKHMRDYVSAFNVIPICMST